MVSVAARPRARRARVPAPRGGSGRPTPIGGVRLRRHPRIPLADRGGPLSHREIGNHTATGPAPRGGSRPTAGIRPDRGPDVAGRRPVGARGVGGSIPGREACPSHACRDQARRGPHAEGGMR
jgi:hypothetical protein